MPTNRLIREKSPYLLQHAHNPVDWFPWSEEAFAKASREDKPIFLSIGYSTCHWCHVMEKESFEDTEIAQLLNEKFVCIKVDREERPDIDNVYMTACQLMTGSGGWPLTIIMTPDRKTFFAATYIPKQNKFGRIGLMTLLPKIDSVWKNQRDNVLKTSDQIFDAVQHTSKDSHVETLDKSILDTTYSILEENFDTKYGGFSEAPKFPSSHNLMFLLRYWKRSNTRKAVEMVEKTLHTMRQGGIYDHIGFGFHRYSTDEKWRVPHFEKMLYDQALLAIAYIEAYQVTKNREYENTAREIFTYVLQNMTSIQGGFYSAEDADSEGEEGKFYLWTYDEILSVLHDEAQLFMKVFTIEPEGNFIEASTGTKNGTNILYLEKSLAEYAKELNMAENDLGVRIETARKKLFDIRNRRVRPQKDDKILTSWNGLMIAALAKAGQVFDEPSYTEAAEKATQFIRKKMQEGNGRLLHRYRDGEAAITAYIDDYAFFIWGVIELYEATFNVDYLKIALVLNDYFIEHFWDKDNGGFYFTPDDGESVLVRQKQSFDGAIPSSNSIALLNLLRLAKITGNPNLAQLAERMISVFAYSMKRNPISHTQSLIALDFMIGPSYEVIIAGNSKSNDTLAMLKALNRCFVPNKIIVLKPTEDESSTINEISGFVKAYRMVNGKATAFVCSHNTCQRPTNDVDTMMNLFGE
jgi:uncharacterized protein YyaL (SSP411 family)